MNVWYLNRIGGMGDWRESAKQGLFAILRTLIITRPQKLRRPWQTFNPGRVDDVVRPDYSLSPCLPGKPWL